MPSTLDPLAKAPPRQDWIRLAHHDTRTRSRRGYFGEAGDKAAVDDVLDAAVAAWSARRYAEGTATALPAPPEVFDDGPAAAIWA